MRRCALLIATLLAGILCGADFKAGFGGRQITVDLATIPTAMMDMVAARVMHRHAIDRSHLLINMSHTHSGPALDWPSNADREMIHRIEGYRSKLMDSMRRRLLLPLRTFNPLKYPTAPARWDSPITVENAFPA